MTAWPRNGCLPQALPLHLVILLIWRRHGFILCGTESTKIISTWYKSYGLLDLYQFLHIKCVLLAQFLNLPFHHSNTYMTIFYLQTRNPQHTTQNNQKWTTAALPSSSIALSLQDVMAPPLPMVPHKACAISLGGAAVGSPVWGANASPIKILRGRRGLGLMWPPINQDTQQSTQGWRKQ